MRVLVSVLAVPSLLLLLQPKAQAGGAADSCAPQGPKVTLHARIRVAPKASLAFDTWVEVAVTGAKSDVSSVCQALVERERRSSYPSLPVVSTVIRPCSETALPRVLPPAPGQQLLVDQRSVNDADYLLAAPTSRCLLAQGGRSRASVITYTRYPSWPACEQARQRLVAARRRASARAKTHAGDWLRDQRAGAEAQAARACERERDSASLEREISRARSRVSKLCRSRATGAGCDRAREQLVELSRRQVDAELHRRECANDQKLVEILRLRVRAPRPSGPPAPEPKCRPE